MAEIYKQQVEYKTTEAEKLKTPPFKNYVAQGLNAVNEGFKQLDEYMAYTDDKMLAGSMDNVKDEAVAMVDEWQDFNTDGRQKLYAKIMEKYDNALASAPMSAQRRFAVSNPDARNIFALKVNEKILEKARNQVYVEKQRDFNAFADVVANIKNPVQNEKALRDMIDRVSEDPDHLLTVDQSGILADSVARKAVIQSIGQAILDERYDTASKYLTNPFYTKFLTPEDDIRFRGQIKSGLKAQKEAMDAAGGNYKEDAQFWIATRDGLYDRFRDVPGAPAFIEEDMNSILSALYSGKPLEDVMILKWVDGGEGISADQLLKLQNSPAAEYWNSLGQTRRQQAINEYNRIVTEVLPEEYKQQQYDISRAFMKDISGHVTTDKDGNDIYDFGELTADDWRTLKREADEVQMTSLGNDQLTQKYLRAFYSAYNANVAEQAKAVSIENEPIQQNMAGLTAGETFLGGGNFSEAMIRNAQNKEEKPSFIDNIRANRTRLSTQSDLTMEEVAKIRSEGGWLSMMGNLSEESIKKIENEPGLKGVGNLLGTGALSPTMSDIFYIDDGGEANSKVIGSGLGKFFIAGGEKKMPEPNTFRFMAYAIPYMMGYISVLGNDRDRQGTGIRQGVINENQIVALKNKLMNYYEDDLDEKMNIYNPSNGQKRATKDEPIYAPQLPQLMNSDPYRMLQSAFNIAKDMGLVDARVEPDLDDMVTLSSALSDIASMSSIKYNIPAKDSGAQKRIDYRTKAMQQHDKLTKKG